jgi:hypothetical protein
MRYTILEEVGIIFKYSAGLDIGKNAVENEPQWPV